MVTEVGKAYGPKAAEAFKNEINDYLKDFEQGLENAINYQGGWWGYHPSPQP